MEKLITWATIACFVVGGVLVDYAVTCYLISHPIVFKISAWMFGIVLVFSLLREAVKAVFESDWLENSFKSNKK